MEDERFKLMTEIKIMQWTQVGEEKTITNTNKAEAINIF
jgi:hypothetical protein